MSHSYVKIKSLVGVTGIGREANKLPVMCNASSECRKLGGKSTYSIVPPTSVMASAVASR